MREPSTKTESVVTQKRLGRKGLVVFLALLSAFVPLSIDLYLPALPVMTEYFGVAEYQTNLTLILFFVFYGISVLVWGPFSDRYGRRPILLIGLTAYTIAGALCAIAPDVYQLMAFRVIQAVGAGAATAVATAIVKDVYRGRKRESILAIVQSMVIISPAIAPIIGALILRFTSWRGAFVAQAILGIAVVAAAIAFQETLQEKQSGRAFTALRRLGVVLANRTFAYMLVIFSLTGIAAMAFITSSSYIYQITFGVSSQVFSYFFAIYAIGMALGPPLYIRLSMEWRRTSIITGCFAVIVVSGLLVLFVGRLGPWPFILALLPSSIAMSCMRPPATYLLLDQHEGDAGSASALMGSAFMVMGSLGMLVVSLQLAGRVELIGGLTAVFGILAGGLWLFVGLPLLRRGSASVPGEVSPGSGVAAAKMRSAGEHTRQ